MSQARLGLALSGGGFRAAFFHLGALRRLAELDLLRHVTTISTVSGGSILAAHYYLHFKRMFEQKEGRLDRADYIQVVRDVEEDFIRGTKKDIRNRLLAHPWTHFRTLCLGYSYGGRIARLYARHLYGPVTRHLFDAPEAERFASEGVPLHRAIVLPFKVESRDIATIRKSFPSSGYPGRKEAGQTLREFNVQPRESRPAVIPRLILNATCLNTGGPFFFMLNEVGSPRIGYVRMDEVFMLVQYKSLLNNLGAGFTSEHYERETIRAFDLVAPMREECPDLPETAFHENDPFPGWTADHIRVYLAAKARTGTTTEIRSVPALQFALDPEIQQPLMNCSLGTLRAAKTPAWYLLDCARWNGPATMQRGGYTVEGHRKLFVEAMQAIAPKLPAMLGATETDVPDEVARLILDLYYFRSSEMIDWNAPKALAQLTLGRAVAASANFPPLFTPYKIFDLYDTDKFDVVALTDGGVNDNQGIDALLDDGCNWIIASDAGGLIEQSAEPPDARLPMMDRIVSMLMDGVRDAQRKVIRSRSVVANIFHMNDRVGKTHLRLVEPELVSHIRTDLDAFNDIEIAALQHNGYTLCDGHVDLATHRRSPFRTPVPPPPAQSTWPRASEKRTRRVLQASASRLGRLNGLFPTFSGVAALVLGYLALLFGGDHYQNIRDFWLGGDDIMRYTFAQDVRRFLEQTGMGRALKGVGDSIGGWLSRRSITGMSLLFIAGIVLSRHSRKLLREWLGAKLPTFRTFEIFKSQAVWLFGVLCRVMNVVSLICLAVFLTNFHAKWLFGVVPLWCFALGIVFCGSWLFGWVWRQVGRIPAL